MMTIVMIIIGSMIIAFLLSNTFFFLGRLHQEKIVHGTLIKLSYTLKQIVESENFHRKEWAEGYMKSIEDLQREIIANSPAKKILEEKGGKKKNGI